MNNQPDTTKQPNEPVDWLEACINDFADDVAEQFGGDTDRHPIPESVKNLPKATIKSKLDSQKAELIKEIREALPKDDDSPDGLPYTNGYRHGWMDFKAKTLSQLAKIERNSET